VDVLVGLLFAGAQLILIRFLTASSPSGAQLHGFWFSCLLASVARQWRPGVGFRKKSQSPLLIAVRVSCEVLSAIRFVCPAVWLSALRPGLSARGAHWTVLVFVFPLSCHLKLSSFDFSN
jgi:hypothetical protein